jgi:HEAT repeat protein
MPRIHPVFGVIAVPLLAAGVLLLQYSTHTFRVNQLIGDLSSSDPTVRQNAVAALARVGDQAIAPLIGALKSPDPHIQEGAESALGVIGDPAVKPLLNALNDSNSGIPGTAVAQALGKIGDRGIQPLIESLNNLNPDQRQTADEALGAIGQPAVQPLIAALNNSSGGGSVTDLDREVKKVFVTIGEPAVDPLVELLRNKNIGISWHARWSAAAALGEIDDPRSIGPLTITAHSDADFDVRASALRALSAIKSAPHSSLASSGTNSGGQHFETPGNLPAKSTTVNTAISDSGKNSTRPSKAVRDAQLAAHLATARELWSSGNTQRALEECNAALRLDPVNTEASALREKYTRALAILNGTSQ